MERGQPVELSKAESGPTYAKILKEIGSDYYSTRQPLIKRIQQETRHKLISYVSQPGHPAGAIIPQDVELFTSILAPLGSDMKGLDLMIYSFGGNADVAEKLVKMCRAFTKEFGRPTTFRVIVPGYAKSAATLIALGADEIIMGVTSELGPIDPQIPQILPGGQIAYTSAFSFLESFEGILSQVEQSGKLNPALIPILQKVDLAFLDSVRKAILRTRTIAMNFLTQYSIKDELASTRIADDLLNVRKYSSHGQMIDAEEARKIGLKVAYLPPGDSLWELIWELYCRSSIFLNATKQVKLFESDTVSLAMRAELERG